ncbi:glutathione S-transferase [Sphingomonas sp. Leaf412]|nr:glutathione S-transferase [Sphingomonas sp. Leaf412]
MTLWDHPFSPYAQKVKIALREKELAFDTVVPGGIGTGGARGDFLAANPRAEVPALIDGDVAVFDSTVILEYLEDAYPDRPMLPAAPADRARVRMVEDVVDTQLEAINWGLTEVRAFGRGRDGAADALLASAERQLAGMFAWLERQLGAADWFTGDRFGWGDAAVAPYLNGSVGHGHAPGGRLADWLARANARASVADTLAEARAARTAGGGMGDVAKAVEQGLFKREYRDHRLEWMIRSGGIDVVTEGMARDNIRFTPDMR